MLSVLAGTAAPVSAQIFTWRDADGRLVLSNKRPDAAADLLHTLANGTVGDRAATRGAARTVTEGAASVASSRFDDLIVEHARRNGVRESLVRAVIQVESAFNPAAVSPKGAIGLMQLMPATARELGVRNAFNPSENVEGGVKYLRQLLDRYDEDEALALAAYNAGPGAVERHGLHVPPYRETRDYVSKVNRLAGDEAGDAPGPTPRQIFRLVEIIDGRPVVKFTDRKPD